MKQYKIKEDAKNIVWREWAKGQGDQWAPNKDQWRSRGVLEVTAGQVFDAFENIERGMSDVYLYIGPTTIAKSEIFALPWYLVEFVREDSRQVDPPVDEECSGRGWWGEQNLLVVRLLVCGFTDGFMAFTKRHCMSSAWAFVQDVVAYEFDPKTSTDEFEALIEPGWYWTDSNNTPYPENGPYATQASAIAAGKEYRKKLIAENIQ